MAKTKFYVGSSGMAAQKKMFHEPPYKRYFRNLFVRIGDDRVLYISFNERVNKSSVGVYGFTMTYMLQSSRQNPRKRVKYAYKGRK